MKSIVEIEMIRILSSFREDTMTSRGTANREGEEEEREKDRSRLSDQASVSRIGWYRPVGTRRI